MELSRFRVQGLGFRIQAGHGKCEHDIWQVLRGKSLFCVGIERPL